MKQITIKIDLDLWKDIKKISVDKEIKLKDIIEKALKDYAKKD